MAEKETEVGKINITLGLDTVQASKNVADFNDRIKVIKSAAKTAGDGTREFAKSVEGLTEKNKYLNLEMDAQKEKMKELKRQHEAAVASGKVSQKEINKLAIQYNNAQGAVNRISAAIDRNSKSIADQTAEWRKVEKETANSVNTINAKMVTLNASYKATIAGVKDFGSSSQDLEIKSKHLTETMALQEQAVKELKKSFDTLKGVKGEDAADTQKAAQKYYEAIAAMKKTESALTDLKQDIAKQGQEWNELEHDVKSAGEMLKEFGGKTKEIGGNLTTSLTAPIALAGGAALKGASDFDSAGAQIQASLGLTAKEAEGLKETATKVWSEGFGEDINEVQESLIQVKQNIHGLNDGELEQVTKDSMTLAKVFNADVNEVTRAGGNLMKGFGLSSKEAYDLMAHGAQNGLNFSNEMFDNLSEYGPLFSKMGFSADEYFQLLEKGSKAGVYNLDYINDAMKEFQIRAKDGSKATSDAMAGMSESTQKLWKDYEQGKVSVKDLHNAVIAELKGMDDQTKANQIGVGLYGTKFEDLEADAMYALGGINGGLQGVDGAMKKSSDAIQESFGVRAKSALREFGAAFLPLGEELLKLAEQYLPKVEAGVKALTDFIAGMSPEAKAAALALAGIAAVIGPLAMAVGSVMTVAGPLVGMLGAIVPAAGGAAAGVGVLGGALGGGAGLAGVMAVLTGPVGLGIAAIAAIGVTAYAVDKQLDKPIMKAKIFGDEISKGTQKAVGAYLKMDSDAKKSLDHLAWSQQTVTTSMANDLKAKYDTMTNTVLAAIDKRSAGQLQKTQKLFADSSVLTANEEAKVIAKMQENDEKKKAQVQKYQDQINTIIDTANKQKRGLSEQEYKDISAIQEKMRTTAVKTMSKSAEEQKKILGTLKSESSKLTAEQAAAVVKNSVTQRDKSIKNAKTQYEKSVEQIRYMRDVSGTISKETADKMIKEAGRQRDKSIEKARDMHQNVVGEAKKQAKGHADEIDWEKGKVLTGWDKMNAGVEKAINWVRGIFDKGKVSSKPSIVHSIGDNSGSHKINAVGRWKGTPAGPHMGGPAIVGEKGPELAHIPSKGVGLVGVNGPEFMPNLERGSSVLPADKTSRVLSQYGFGSKMQDTPMYETGVGDYFDDIMKGPKALWDKAASKFGAKDSLMPSWLTKHTGSIVSNVGGMAKDTIQGWIDDWLGAFGGGGSEIGSYYLSNPFRITTRFTPNGNKNDRVHKGGVHKGLDLAAPAGTAIKSLTDGIVKQVISGSKTAGNGVRIQSGKDLLSYIHMLRTPPLKTGQKVKTGQIIGQVGSTGFSTGPHLDLKIQRNGKYIDPLTYLQGGGGGVMGGSWNGQYKDIIKRAAAANKISPALIAGIIQQESKWNPRARSGVGAGGLMQLMPSTARGLGVKNVFDPAQNIAGGSKYIKQMLNLNHGNLDLALASYNAGYGNVLKYHGIPPFKETRNYVRIVKSNIAKFGGKFEKGGVIDQHAIYEGGETGAEVVVPVNQKRKKEGLKWWLEAGRMLGALGMGNDGKMSTTPVSNNNVSNNNNSYEMHFHFPEGATTTNGNLDYRKIAIGVQTELQKLNKLNNRYQGVIIQ
jgi:phage-related minor tail protein